MKKVLNFIKKNIFGVIISGIIFGSIGVYAGTKLYASDVSVNAPTGSSLGSNATLQDSLDELYSIADNNDKIETRLTNLESKESKQTVWELIPNVSVQSGITTTVKEVNLTPGTYIIFFSKSFNANTSGYRRISLSLKNSNWGVSTSIGASQSDSTIVNMTVPLLLGRDDTLKFIAQQNSGSTLTGSALCQIIKLI